MERLEAEKASSALRAPKPIACSCSAGLHFPTPCSAFSRPPATFRARCTPSQHPRPFTEPSHRPPTTSIANPPLLTQPIHPTTHPTQPPPPNHSSTASLIRLSSPDLQPPTSLIRLSSPDQSTRPHTPPIPFSSPTRPAHHPPAPHPHDTTHWTRDEESGWCRGDEVPQPQKQAGRV